MFGRKELSKQISYKK